MLPDWKFLCFYWKYYPVTERFCWSKKLLCKVYCPKAWQFWMKKKYIYPTLLCRYWSICVFITSVEKEHFNPCEYGLFGEIMCLMDCSQSLLLLEMFPHLDSKGWKRFLLVAGSRCINMWWKCVPPYWDLFSDISVENNLQFFFFYFSFKLQNFCQQTLKRNTSRAEVVKMRPTSYPQGL